MQQRHLCDVEVVVGAQRYLAHKLVLASGSEYFNEVLRENKPARQQDNNQCMQVVSIPNEDEEAVQAVIEYCYTGIIELRETSAKNVMSAASLLQMDDILNAFCKFLQKNLRASNCIGFWLLAKTHPCINLENLAYAFAERQFMEVFGYKEFLRMEAEELNTFIKSDSIVVNSEEFVFNIVKEWLLFDSANRERHLFTLLSNVKLPLLSTEFLFDQVTPICDKSDECKKLRDEALLWHTVPARRPQLISNRTRPRGFKAVAIGLWKSPMIKLYNADRDTWSNYGTLEMGRLHFGLTMVKDKLMAIGGLDGSATVGKCEYINLKTYEKEMLPPLNTPRWGAAAATAAGYVFAIGGWDGSNYSDIVEKWDPEAKMWTYAAATPFRMMLGTAAVLNEILYVAGGRDEFAALDSVISYNPLTNKWKRCSPMKEKRNYVGLAAYGSYLYAVGGCVGYDTNSDSVKTVERYDPASNRWTYVASLSSDRSGVAAGVLNNRLIALGGRDRNTHFPIVEVYDDKADKWESFASLGTVPGVFQLLSVPPGALEIE